MRLRTPIAVLVPLIFLTSCSGITGRNTCPESRSALASNSIVLADGTTPINGGVGLSESRYPGQPYIPMLYVTVQSGRTVEEGAFLRGHSLMEIGTAGFEPATP